MLDLPEGFKEKFDKAVDLLDDHDKFRIITHYDADGISAAAVISRALMKAGKGFHSTFVHSAPKNPPKGLPLIYTDVGASDIKKIYEMDDPVILLDHHRIDEVISDKDDKVFINPHEFGIDGAREISGGTLALLLAVSYDETNWIKSVYALAGSASDKQDVGGFKGLNKQILEESLEKGVITKNEGIFIDGDGIRDALLKSCDPYFPGISGDESKIDDVLKSLKLDAETPVDNISKDKERKLTSLMTLSLLKRDIPSHIIESIKGYRYMSSRLKITVDELYKVMNACARISRPGLALSFCLGDTGALDDALELREDYRNEMVKRLQELEKEGPEVMKNIQYFYESQKTRKGELAGLGMMYLFHQDKPSLGICNVDRRVDISARGTISMVEKGLDLGSLCRTISGKLGGSGGGHDIAAGATVDRTKIDDFLKQMNQEVGKILWV